MSAGVEVTVDKGEFDAFGDAETGMTGTIASNFRITGVEGDKMKVLFENPDITVGNNAQKQFNELTRQDEEDDAPDVDTDDI